MEKKSKKFSLSFFFKKTVIITGLNGFKGFWLYLFLKKLGANVEGIGIDGNNFKVLKKVGIKKNNFLKNTDINNYKDLKKYIIKKKPDIIFHLASESLVFECDKNPIKAINTNILGLSKLLLILKDIKSKKKISINIITSDKCYLPQNKKSYRENDRLGGNDIYSSTKACQEIMTNSIYKSYFQEKKNIYINTFRAGNVVGGGDYSANRLFPDIYKTIKNNVKLFIRNRNSTRPWQHVLDTLHGYLLATEYSYKKKINFENWNFSPNTRSYSVDNIIKKLIKVDLIKKHQINFKKNIVKETTFLNLNSKKTRKLLKWKSVFNLNETIKDTFDVYSLLDEKISSLQKIKLLEQRLKNYLNRIYGDTHRIK